MELVIVSELWAMFWILSPILFIIGVIIYFNIKPILHLIGSCLIWGAVAVCGVYGALFAIMALTNIAECLGI